MPRYIRYMEDGVWKYASIKDVGDTSLLKTSAKQDIVSSINSLIDGGIIEVVQPSINNVQGQIDSQAITISNTQQLTSALQIKADDLEQKASSLQTTVNQHATDLTTKADKLVMEAELQAKVSLTQHQADYNQITTNLNTKVDIAQHQADYNQITTDLATKASNISVQDMENRINQDLASKQTAINTINADVSTLKQDTSQLKQDVVSKVSKLDYATSTGENQWLVKRFDTLFDGSPTLEEVKVLTANHIQAVDDFTSLSYNMDNYTVHLTTNAFVSIDKNVSITVSKDNAVSVYVNDVLIHTDGDWQLSHTIALPLKTGWNKIDVIYSEATGGDYVGFNTKLSTLVDKMSYREGTSSAIVNQRLTSAEATIQQNANSISLKAEKTDVYTKGETDGHLSGKVSQIEFNNKVAEIQVTTDGITQSVSNTNAKIDSLKIGGRNLLLGSADYTGSGWFAESSSITSEKFMGANIAKSYSDWASIDYKVSDLASRGIMKLGKKYTASIYARVTSGEKPMLFFLDGSEVHGYQIGTLTTSWQQFHVTFTWKQQIIDLNSQLRFETNALNGTGIEFWVAGFQLEEGEKATDWQPSVEDTQAEFSSVNQEMSVIDQKADSIQLSVNSLNQTVNSHGQSISSHGASIGLLQDQVSLKAEKTDVYTKAEADEKLANGNIYIRGTGLNRNGFNIVRVNGVDIVHGQEIRGHTVVALRRTDLVVVSNQTFDTHADLQSGSMIEHLNAFSDDVILLITTFDSAWISSQLADALARIGGTGALVRDSRIPQAYIGIPKLGKGSGIEVVTWNTADAPYAEITTKIVNGVPQGINTALSAVERRVTSAESTLTVQADQIATKVSQTDFTALSGDVNIVKQDVSTLEQTSTQIQTTVSSLDSRLGSAETQITQNANSISLKADQVAVNDLGTRMTSAESNITLNANEISQRVTKTEYDSAVGVNKWVSSYYNVNTGSAWAIPHFNHIKGRRAEHVVELPDAGLLKAFDSDYYITHFFTNVYMNTARTVTLSVTNDDGVNIFLNGASVFSRESSGTPAPVSLSFRAGWNTVEILLSEYAGSEGVFLSPILSSQVDKMTAVIGVGRKDDTRLTEAETAIIQNADSIALKASQTEVTSLGNRVTNNEGSIIVLNNEIATKVSQTDFNAYSSRLTTAESTIQQHSDSIALKVNRTDHDALNTIVQSNSSQINQLNESIALKVEQSTFNAVEQRVSSAEGQININTNAIALKASQANLDSVSGRLTTAEGSLTVANDQIATKVSQVEFNAMKIGGRNYLAKSKGNVVNDGSWSYAYNEIVHDPKYGDVNHINADGMSWGIYQLGDFKAGDDFTVSIMMRTSSSFTPTFQICLGDGTQNWTGGTVSFSQQVETDWTLVSYTGKIGSQYNGSLSVRLYMYPHGKEIWIAYAQLEKGTRVTSWNYALEDVDDKINSKVNTVDYNAKVSEIKQTTDSITSSVSSVSQKVDSIAVGSRNLLKNGNFAKDFEGWDFSEWRNYNSVILGRDNWGYTIDDGTPTYYMRATGVIDTAVGGLVRSNNIMIKPNTEYTVSYLAQPHRCLFEHEAHWADANGNYISYLQADGLIKTNIESGRTTDDRNGYPTFRDGQSSMKRYYITSKAPANAKYLRVQLVMQHSYDDAWLFFDNFQVEEGNVATDFKPSNEDIITRFSSAESRIAQTENSIQLKASQTDLNTTNSNVTGLTTRMSSAESQLNVQAGLIEARVTKTEFSDMKIGGQNLLSGSAEYTGDGWQQEAVSVLSNRYSGAKIVQTSSDWGSIDYRVSKLVSQGIMKIGHKYTFSVYARVTSDSRPLNFYNEGNEKSNTQVGTLTTEWQRFSVTFTWTQQIIDTNSYLRFETYNINGTGISLQLAGIQLEEGTVATAYSPHQDDAVNNLQIGGRNLLRDSDFEGSVAGFGVYGATGSSTITSSSDYSYHGSKSLKHVNVNQTDMSGVTQIIDYNGQLAGKTLTLSWKVRGIGSSIGKKVFANIYDNISYDSPRTDVVLTDKWQTIKTTKTISPTATHVYVYWLSTELVNGDIVYADCVQLEEGTVHTDWQPSPDDVSADISTLGTRMTSAETRITQTENDIQLKASQSSLDNLTGRVSSAESSLQVAHNQIATKVSQTDFNNLKVGGRNLIKNSKTLEGYWFLSGGHVKTYVTGDTPFFGVTDTLIKLSVVENGNTGNVFRIYAVKELGLQTFSVWYKSAVAGVQQTFYADINDLGQTGFTATDTWQKAVVTVDNTRLNSTYNFVDIEVWYGHSVLFYQPQLEMGGKATDWMPSPEDVDGSIDVLKTRMSSAETSITQTSNQIQLKANSVDVYTKGESDSNLNAKVDGVQVGGRNLLRNTGNFKDTSYWYSNGGSLLEVVDKDGHKVLHGRGSYAGETCYNVIKPNTYYMYSIEIMFSQDTWIDNNTPIHFQMGWNPTPHAALDSSVLIGGHRTVPANTWVRLIIQIKTTSSFSGTPYFIPYIYGDQVNSGISEWWLKNIQLEEGNKATTWQPNPLDIDGKIDSLTTRISSAETSITQNANQIALKASQSSLDSLEGRVSSAEASLTVANNQIATKVSSSTYEQGISDTRSHADSKANTAETNAKTYTDQNTGNLLDNPMITGSIGRWNDNGTNGLSLEDTPFADGRTIKAFKSVTSESAMYVHKAVKVDPSKAYEVTVWFKSDSYSGTDYLGLYAMDAGSNNIGADEINIYGEVDTYANTNSYAWYGDNAPINTWIKRTFYIIPSGTDPAKMKSIGENVDRNMRMLPNTRWIQIRWLNYYNGGITQTLYMANPKMVEVDPNAVIASAQANNRAGALEARMTSAETSITQTSNSIALKANASEVYTKGATDSLVTDRVNAVKVGGRNLVRNGDFANDFNYWSFYEWRNSGTLELLRDNGGGYRIQDGTHTYYMHAKNGYAGTVGGVIVSNSIPIKPNVEYTVSYYLNTHRAIIDHETHWLDADGNFIGFFNNYQTNQMDGDSQFSSELGMIRHVSTAKAPSNARYVGVQFVMQHSHNDGYVFFDNVQLEEGNKVSPFSKAPEDVDKKIDDAITRISSAESSLTVQANQIATKVTQTEIDNSIANVKIGGRNLLRNTGDFKDTSHWTLHEYALTNAGVKYTPYVRNDAWTGNEPAIDVRIERLTSGEYGIFQNVNGLAVGKQYMLSGYIAGHRTGKRILIRNASSGWITSQYIGDIYGGGDLNNWYKFNILFTAPTSTITVEFNIENTSADDGYMWLKHIMLEEGNKASAWSPNPLDVDNQINGLTTRMSSAESSITQNANQIALKVNATDVYTKGETDSKLASGDLYVRGTGLNRNANRLVKLNGQTILNSDIRGTNLICVRRSDLVVVADETYDTHASLDTQSLVNRLWGIGEDVIVVLSTYDSAHINQGLADVMIAFGGTGKIIQEGRVPWAFVGMRGLPKGSAIEVITWNTSSSPYAEISTSIKDGVATGWNSALSTIEQRVSNAESSITQNANQIALKVTQSQVDTSIANVKVGGQNLLDGTQDYRGWRRGNTQAWIDSSLTYNGLAVQKQNWDWSYFMKDTQLEVGKTYTISCYARRLNDNNTPVMYFSVETDKITWQPCYLTTTWTRYEMTFTASGQATALRIECNNLSNTGNEAWIAGIKLEEGNKSTSWSPSANDMKAYNSNSTPVKVRYIRDWLNGSTANPGNHWVEIQAYSNGINLALNKSISSSTNLHYSLENVVNGSTHTDGYGGVNPEDNTPKYIQVDLGGIYDNVEYLHIWHYYGDERTYYNKKTEVSEDGIVWYTLYDEKIHGTYRETSSGFIIPVNLGKTIQTTNQRISSAESSITQNANSINLKVSKNNVISEINQTSESIKIQANRIDINGAVTFSSLDGNMQNTINNKADTSYVNTAEANAKEVARAMALGKMLYPDPTFKKGWNGMSIYNNEGNGNVVMNRIGKPYDAPTTSPYAMEITTNGYASPHHGGFFFNTSTRPNAVFIVRFVAKIPSGRWVNWHTNSIGDGGSSKWLTSNMGTDKYEEYIFKVTCGSTGTFHGTNFFAIEGGGSPFTWYVAYATVFDVTDFDDTIEGWKMSGKTTINGGMIETDTVTAVQINVSDLSAISANLGTVNAGTINGVTINGTTINSTSTDNLKKITMGSGGSLTSTSYTSTGEIQSFMDLSSGMLFFDYKGGGTSSIMQVSLDMFGFEIYAPPSGQQLYLQGNRLYFSRMDTAEKVELGIFNRSFATGDDYYGTLSTKKGLYMLREDGVLNSNHLAFSGDVNAIYFDGYGNIRANSNTPVGSFWNMKDGSGRIRLSIPVGANSTGAVELRGHSSGVDFYHDNYKIISAYQSSGNANRILKFGDGGIFKWQNTATRFEARTSDDLNWEEIAGIITNASSREYKKNIEAYNDSALDIINMSSPKLYHYNTEEDTSKKRIGLIAEEAPLIVQDKTGTAVDAYGMTTLAWKAIQELSEQVRYLRDKIERR